MEEFNAAIEVFPDLKDPIKQFEAFAKAVNNIARGGGALGAALNSFDLTTAEGVAAAEKVLQGLFAQLEAGTLTAAQLGGMSPEEFLQALLQGLDLVRAAGAGGPAGTGGFNVDRTITEVTGSRMAALLSTGNVFAEKTAANTEALLRLFGGGVPTALISPPSITPSGSAGVIGGVTFGDITIVVQIAAGEVVADPEAVGRKLARGFVQQISQGQATELSWRKRATGNVVNGGVN
jgi:hypothetical protein